MTKQNLMISFKQTLADFSQAETLKAIKRIYEVYVLIKISHLYININTSKSEP